MAILYLIQKLGGNSMKHIQRITMLLLAVTFFTGCAMNNGAREDANDRDNVRIQNYDKDWDVNNRGARVQNADNDNLMRQADDVADKVDDLKEVRNATVIVTDSTAYVAVVLRDNETGNVRKDLENKISDRVKSTDKSIDRVYVSSNPDFVDRMSDYGDKIRSGHPIRGIYDEFTETVQRVFPTAR